MEFASLPPTRPDCYLTGLPALNLVSESGTGDWHASSVFASSVHLAESLAGAGCVLNTNDLLGDIGVYDCTEVLKRMGLRWEGEIPYAATHARATADLVLKSIRRGSEARHIRLDDWMPSEEDKEEVFALLQRASNGLAPDELARLATWCKRNG